MTSFNAVQTILKSPDAPQQVAALQQALADEAKRRQAFYEWIDENTKAEFINGQVIIHSPVRKEHWEVSDLLSSILSVFTRIKKLGRVGVEKVMIRLTRNDYEPDIVFFEKKKADTFTKGQVLFPAPDFVVEILSDATASTDKTTKKNDYAAHGVQEYWIIDPKKCQIEQYILLDKNDKTYFPPKIHRIDDTITSKVIEGFVIPVRALFDEAVNIQTLEDLLNK
jgi:Uma2 family endonuclease